MAFGLFRCGIYLAEVWRLSRSSVAFGEFWHSVLRSPCLRGVVPESLGVRPWRGIVGNEAIQVGASAVNEQFVAVRVGWGGGLLLGVECQEGCVQGLRGALSGTCEIHEISVYIAFVQHVVPFVVDFDMLLEAVHGRLDVPHQQLSVAAVHTGYFQPGCPHGQPVHHFLPGTYGAQQRFRSAEVIADGE